MHEPVPSKPRPSVFQRLRRWGLRAALLLVMVVVVGWLLMWYFGSSRLDQVRAEADRLDPGWRWDDLQAKRANYPDEQNGSVTVSRITGLLPAGWDAPFYTPGKVTPEGTYVPSLQERVVGAAPNERPDPEVLAAYQASVASAPDALKEANRLADQPRGRLLLPANFDVMTGNLLQVQETRKVATFINYVAQTRAAAGDYDGALTANRAILNAGGSLGDEPIIIVQLVRMAVDAVAAANLERLLAQGQASPAELERLQQAYEAALADPVLLTALRGERAGMDKQEYYRNMAIPGGPPPSVINFPAPGWQDNSFATMLQFMNRGVEAAKLPPDEQRREFEEWEKDIKIIAASRFQRIMNLHAVLMLPAMQKVAMADSRRQVGQGCAVLALAAERYRLQHGKWPEKIEDLRPLVKDIPIDPFATGPLKLKRTADGLIIYSVGVDEQDNGGNLDRTQPLKKGSDLGFQLWDVEKRRQPAKPPMPMEPVGAMP